MHWWVNYVFIYSWVLFSYDVFVQVNREDGTNFEKRENIPQSANRKELISQTRLHQYQAAFWCGGTKCAAFSNLRREGDIRERNMLVGTCVQTILICDPCRSHPHPTQRNLHREQPRLAKRGTQSWKWQQRTGP